MRISTNTLHELGTSRITDLQASMVRTQQQVATGRRILSPADDPIASARALELAQGKSINEQYAVNRRNATNSLMHQEGVLTSVTTLIQDVQTLVVQAGNGTLDDQQRGYIAAELQGRFEELLSLANSRDSSGNYLFAGYQVTSPPFTATSAGAAYNGDQGQRMLQIDAHRQIALGNSGNEVFEQVQNGNARESIFTTLRNLISVLNQPAADSAGRLRLTEGLSEAGSALDSMLDNVLTVRTSVGARLKEIDSLNSAGSERDLQYARALSELQDVDYAQALSNLARQQVMLEAAQRSFLKVSELSLFKIL